VPPNFITTVCESAAGTALNDSPAARRPDYPRNASTSTRLSLKVGALPAPVRSCEVVAWELRPPSCPSRHRVRGEPMSAPGYTSRAATDAASRLTGRRTSRGSAPSEYVPDSSITGAAARRPAARPYA
jgi:hypothetical protein